MLPTKEEFLKMVYENETLKMTLKKSKDDKDERRYKAAVDEIVGGFYENFVQAFTSLQKNPEEVKKLVSEQESKLINDSGDVAIVTVGDK